MSRCYKYTGSIFSGSFSKQLWEIPSSELAIQRKLGEGTFGIVHLAAVEESLFSHKFQLRGRPYPYETSSNDTAQLKCLVAVKAFQLTGNTRTFSVAEVMKEIRIMENLDYHPNLVTLLGAYQETHQIGLVLEYCPGGCLLGHLRTIRKNAITGSLDTLYLVEYPQQQQLKRGSVEEDEAGYCVPRPENSQVAQNGDTGLVFRLKFSIALSYAKQIALGMV